jgi:hypothetical protein
MNASLEALLRSAAVWRAREKAEAPAGAIVPTGWPALDAALPGGGWPLGTLVEFLLPGHGVGELRLLLPALRRLEAGAALGAARAGEGDAERRWIVWVAPPLAPYPPALGQAGVEPSRQLLVEAEATQDRLWAMEQALHSRSCSAVLAWLDTVDDRWLRRLKLAAEPGRALAVLFRPIRRREQASPATLRLALEPRPDGLDVWVLKSRGGGPRRVRNPLGS